MLQRRRPEGDEPTPHYHEPAVALRQRGRPEAQAPAPPCGPHRRSTVCRAALRPAARHRRGCSDDASQTPAAPQLSMAAPCSSPLRERRRRPPGGESRPQGQGNMVGGRDCAPQSPGVGALLLCTSVPAGFAVCFNRQWFSQAVSEPCLDRTLLRLRSMRSPQTEFAAAEGDRGAARRGAGGDCCRRAAGMRGPPPGWLPRGWRRPG